MSRCSCETLELEVSSSYSRCSDTGTQDGVEEEDETALDVLGIYTGPGAGATIRQIHARWLAAI